MIYFDTQQKCFKNKITFFALRILIKGKYLFKNEHAHQLLRVLELPRNCQRTRKL